MGIAIANCKNRCDLGAQRSTGNMTWWTFRRRKEIFSHTPPPPPKICQFAKDTLPAPSAPPGLPPPLLSGIFNKNRTPPLPRRFGLPLPPPRAEKNKNIWNVHQDDHEGKTHPKNHPPKWKQFTQTVCANNFGTICTNCPPFPFKISGKQTKEFAQTVCASSFYLGGWFFGWVAFPWFWGVEASKTLYWKAFRGLKNDLD